MTLFSQKPYDPDAWLNATDNTVSVGAEEIPLEYHINHHTQTCSCGRRNCWSELTLITFNRARKCRIVRAAPAIEYNLPVNIHNLAEQVVNVCFFCAPFRTFDQLPKPIVPVTRTVPLGWRQISQPQTVKAGARTKAVVTDDDLLA